LRGRKGKRKIVKTNFQQEGSSATQASRERCARLRELNASRSGRISMQGGKTGKRRPQTGNKEVLGGISGRPSERRRSYTSLPFSKTAAKGGPSTSNTFVGELELRSGKSA